MNMLLHGIEAPDIRYRDSLSEGAASDEARYSLVLANPPFAGSLDYESTSKALLKEREDEEDRTAVRRPVPAAAQTRWPGGGDRPRWRAVRSSIAHRTLRKRLVEEQKLDAGVKLPPGAFRPYARVSTAILFFTRTDSGGTDDVWFYDIQADGWSLDDKRSPLLVDDKLGCLPKQALSDDEGVKNNLPDALARWRSP